MRTEFSDRDPSGDPGPGHAAIGGDAFPVVGIGASAGGLAVLIRFLEAMPAESGMAFVLIQHLDPHHESLTAQLLGAHTDMTVVSAEDRMRLAPDRVHVIPPNAYLAIRDGRLHLSAPVLDRGMRMPIDHFFRSLATEMSRSAVGILLSGTGSDGTLGLQAIKANDGMTMAQDPETAQYDGMVRSAIDAGFVDYVLPVERIPATLIDYVQHAARMPDQPDAPTLPEEALAAIIDLLARHTGRNFREYKRGTLQRRIARRMAVHHLDDVEAYVAHLGAHAEEVGHLFNDLLISVTSFFREPEAYEALARLVIGPLVAAHDSSEPIRVWVPACASGEEAYSIAMLFDEALAAAKKRCPLKIFATDINEAVLDVARAGVYPEGIASDVSADRLQRYFRHEGSQFRISKEIRHTITFASQDLIVDPPYSKLHLISCRNLLIYLQPDLQQRLLSLFHFSLVDGGSLFLGGSETIGASDLFEILDRKARVYRKRRVAGSRVAGLPFGGMVPVRPERLPAPAGRRRQSGRAGLSEQVERHLLAAHTPPAVVVDDRRRIRYSHGDVDRYLQRPSGVPTDDLLAQAREGLCRPLRDALQAAETASGKVHTDVVPIRDGESAWRRIRICAEPVVVVDSDERFVLVTFEESVAEDAERLPVDGAESDDVLIRELERELEMARGEQWHNVEELEATNEELKSANEEALSMNEELQSTNEELETAKEELQSMNEELTTVNMELEGKLDELEAANDDLKNLLAGTEIAILFLDADARIKRFTPAMQRLFNLISTDVGRPLTDIAHRFADRDLHQDIERVMSGAPEVETEVATTDGRWYLQCLRPYLTSAGAVTGVVATFVDISERKAGELTDRRLAALMRDSNDAVIVFDVDGRIMDWSRGAERLYGWRRSEIVGASMLDLVPAERHDETRELLTTLALGVGVESFETRRLTRDGRVLDVWLTATAVGSADGGGDSVIATTERDITQRERELEAARSRAEELSAQKTVFMASANHDLRQPLQTLRLLNATLASQLDNEAALGLLTQQSRNLETMQALLDTLLDVTRLELGQVTPQVQVFPATELCSALGDHFDAQARAKGLKLRVVPCDVLVQSDRQILRSILHNLVSNAITHTEAGKVLVGCRRRGDMLRIEVRDTGPGIPESEFETIFDDFHQLDNAARERDKGTGLGLPLTRRMADLLGHPLEVRSWPGRGSMFAITVPVAVDAPSDIETEPPVQPPLPPTQIEATLLLVEDDPDVAAALGMLWDVVGLSHVAVAHGSEAIEQVEAKTVVPDIVICDYWLPGEMNGIEVIQAIRARLGRSIPGVLLTGDTTSIGPDDVAREDCVLVYKPADPAALLRLIEDLLEAGRGER